MHPQISICIPAYKQPERLAMLFESIEKQTIQPFEVIVSDDSNDDSVKRLCESSTLPIKYFHNSKALGSPQNWNHAISRASGEWIKLIHHDDYFTHERALELLIEEAAKHPDADYFFSGTTIQYNVDGKTVIYKVDARLIEHLSEIPAYLFHKNLIGAPSNGFFKKSVNLQYDPQLMWLVDIEYYVRLLGQYKVSYVNDPLVTTVISDIQLTTTLKNNRNVEVREFLHCYSKHIGNMNTFNRKIMRYRMLNVLKEFHVTSKADIRSTGYTQPIPEYVNLLLFFLKLNRRAAFSLFYRLNHFSLEKLWL